MKQPICLKDSGQTTNWLKAANDGYLKRHC